MIYEDPGRLIEHEMTPAVVDTILSRGPLDHLRVLPVVLGMDPPDGIDVERICLDLAGHPDAWVRGNAATGMGHLARVTGRLQRKARIKRALQALLQDERALVCGKAGDAISDIEIYLGWSFEPS
ncbi:hypothetical protein AAG614_15315 [Citromicrobium bathyomarinum]